MSLVNEMLRDLDRRRRMPASLDSGGYATEDGPVATSGRNHYLLGLGIVIVLLIAVIAAVLINNNVPQQAPTVVSTPVSPVTETLVPRQVGSGTQVVGMVDTASSLPVARVAGERQRSNGTELRIEVTEKVPFAIVSQSESALAVLLTGVGSVSNDFSMTDNATLEVTGEGLLLKLDNARDSDFVVYENTDGGNFAVIVQSFWRALTATEPMQDVTAGMEQASGNQQAANSTPVSNSAPVAPVRTQRALSLEERDRNATQNALRQVRSGQMQAAYNALYQFIASNPEAHQSRNTLITLLYAQQQFEQVSVLVDEGLMMAPNLAAYKKMKARLLMTDDRANEAVSLLKTVPPTAADDPEYFELLASLLQQTGDYRAAIDAYQDLIRTDRSVGRWWAGMGISHESLGNRQEAINSFEVALQTTSLDSNLRQYSRNRIKALTQ